APDPLVAANLTRPSDSALLQCHDRSGAGAGAAAHPPYGRRLFRYQRHGGLSFHLVGADPHWNAADTGAARRMVDERQYPQPAGIVREVPGRLLVTVRVTPRAARDDISLEGDRLRIRLHAPPVEGAANAALLEMLAKRLGVPRRAVTLEHGETSREK